MFSLTAALRRAAQLNPAGDALRHEGRSQPWRTFPDRVARLAGGLAALGVGPGDRVAVLALNSDYYYEFYFAVAWVGGVFVPINTRLAGPEIVHWLSDSGEQGALRGRGLRSAN